MTTALSPHVRILQAVVSDIPAAALNADLSIEGFVLNETRHWRFKAPRSDQWPVISVRFVGDDDFPAPQACYGEAWRKLDLDLVIDAEMADEGDDQAEGVDPTGLDWTGRALAAATARVLDSGSNTSALIQPPMNIGPIIPSDDTDNTEGRLSRSISLLYRVSSEDPNKLFAQGVDA